MIGIILCDYLMKRLICLIRTFWTPIIYSLIILSHFKRFGSNHCNDSSNSKVKFKTVQIFSDQLGTKGGKVEVKTKPCKKVNLLKASSIANKLLWLSSKSLNFERTFKMNGNWAVVVAQLTAWSFLIPEDPGSNAVIGYFHLTFICFLLFVEKKVT